MKKGCVILLVCVMGLMVQADYYIAGSFGEEGGPNWWNSSGDLMTETAPGSGIWEATVTGLDPESRYEFKVTDGSWDWCYPWETCNSWLYTDASGNITITFNTNTVSDGWKIEQFRLGLSTDPGSWTVAGIGDWDNANPANAMTNDGGGMYSFSAALAAGEYWFKPVVTGSWDSIAENGRSVATENMYVNLTSDATLNVYVDALSGIVRSEVVPEPATMALVGLGSLAMLRRRK